MSESQSIVLVVDDDISVRESLELLLRNEGLDVETFVSAQEFLSRPPVSCTKLPGIGHLSSRTEWSRFAEASCGGTA